MRHTIESLNEKFNLEVIVPESFYPKKGPIRDTFEAVDWLFIKEKIAQAGPSVDESVKNVKFSKPGGSLRLTCKKKTKPRRNFTLFYRRIATNTIMVIGQGKHISDTKSTLYEVSWADGSANKIDLSVSQEKGGYYLINPIGGKFKFRTLDVLINRFCLVEDI